MYLRNIYLFIYLFIYTLTKGSKTVTSVDAKRHLTNLTHIFK